MSTIVTRAGKGSPLTHNEVDANFNNLNTDKVEKTAAAITGGTINGTSIGATTPSTGAFTTITGQTGRLNGTGNNFFPVTTTLSSWSVSSGTLTLSTATTDPFGGTSVYKLVANNGFDPSTGSNAILSTSAVTLPLGVLFTQSIYFKAAEFSALRIRNNSSGEIYTFTIGVTPVATSGVLTPALTLISNGWYRASWSFVTGQIGSLGRSDNWSFRLASTGDGVSGIYVSSPQLEIGSTLNSYTANTSASALYGTPTLSFSGVSEIGLQSNGALYLQPAGTGAIQAQATTSTTAGGNVRGANAVDWQTLRSSAAQVASGSYSVIGGGYNNTASGFLASVFSGLNNQSTGLGSFVGAGQGVLATRDYAVSVGGFGNNASGYFNVICGGASNSGTANAAVTTQATTTVTSGSTAVTLSGSNANIKVGQLITGTGIVSYTYVAAISGTSLTLSQNANASGSPTLSFFTPHGVVVGGGNNQATGSYSFIGGGGDAGTSANRNVASGDWSAVAGGWKNTASSNYSFVGGGGGNIATTNFGSVVCGGGFFGNAPTSISGNSATGTSSFVGAGFSNIASGFGSVVGGGNTNYANSLYSAVIGGYNGTTRGIIGSQVFPAHNGPLGAGQGASQAALLILGVQTTDATATVLRSDTSAASTTNQVILPNNSAYYFTGEVVSGVTGGGNSKGWEISGLIKRGANAAATTLVGSTVTSLYADAGAATWTIALAADTTNGGLRVTFTGQAGTTIRTVCQIRTTEMTY